MSRYESHNLEDMELPFIYKERSVRPTGLMFGSANWHENVELLYVVEGEGAISDNGRVLRVAAGDITVFGANHLHTLAAGERPLLHRYLIVDRSFCLANGVDTSALSFEMHIGDPRVRDLLEELDAAYREPPTTPCRTLRIKSLVLQIMTVLCCDHSTPIVEAERVDRSASYVKEAIDYIRASYGRSFSLDDVAAFVGINKCYLSREFHRYTGCSFVSYVNRTRCKMAQQLLADERISISDVGRQCGFESRSYFARSFRRYVGMLPSEYRESILKRATGGDITEA